MKYVDFCGYPLVKFQVHCRLQKKYLYKLLLGYEEKKYLYQLKIFYKLQHFIYNININKNLQTFSIEYL